MSAPNSHPSRSDYGSESESRTGTSRRRALQQWIALGLAGTALDARAESLTPSLPSRVLLANQPEDFWSRLRSEQFLLGPSRIFLNNGSLGVMPRPVLAAVTASLTAGAEYATDEVVRWGYETLDAERAEMAEFLGCTKNQLAFTHNCTAAMNIIANGLDLKPGDEIVTTDQEHPGGSACWRVKEARYGVVVRAVRIPTTPKSPEELTDCLVSAFGPRTRVVSFSGITSPTGLILPVREICAAAREKGVISVVDGAHMDGQVPVNLEHLGCDYFAGSPHKWMFAPPGSGVLYGRGDSLDHLWPCVTTSGWDNAKNIHAARFVMIGTNGRSTIDGMLAGIRFIRGLGETTIFTRLHQLARLALSEARERAYLELVTPDDSRFFQAMISVRFKSEDLEPLWATLKKRKICVLGGQRLRLSFHVHTRPSDIHAFFEACDEVFAG